MQFITKNNQQQQSSWKKKKLKKTVQFAILAIRQRDTFN